MAKQKSKTKEEIEQQVIQLREKILAEDNEQTVQKITECLLKWEKEQLNIGFCGHFSAGKSTMINKLLGKDLLPSSPIPTSANVVTLCYGEPQARILFTDQTEISVPIAEVEKWKEYCKDGQLVEQVLIYDHNDLLADGLQFLDTPGIDSTDNAHQAATEAALHLADVIFFVTDYNHVQSEINFHFIKSLKEKGKTLFLLINQIDKHREQELSLASFQQRVQDGLAEWGIKVDGLLFTSMRYPDHPYNQFEQVLGLCQQLKENKESLIQEHFIHSLDSLIKEHGQFLLARQEQEREVIQQRIEQIKALCHYEEHPSLLTEYYQAQSAFARWQAEGKEEMEKILENAIITPYSTTQAAQALIESYQKDFKIGWLFSKKKTDEERSKRLDNLYEELAPKVLSQIEWHLKELISKQTERYQLQDQEFQEASIAWSLTIPKEWLLDLLRTETVSREFVYTYTKELSQRINALYRERVLEVLDSAQAVFEKQHSERFQGLESKLKYYQEIEQEESKLHQLDHSVQEQVAYYQELLRKIAAPTGGRQSFELAQLDLRERQEQEQDLASVIPVPTVPVKQKQIPFDREPIQQAARQLEQAANLLQEIPSLASLTKELYRKAERLHQNQFTICLFGAFSAGKSSFANALLGANVLPVSPNPTTAAINQVLAPKDTSPAGSALINMKSRQQIEEEIALSLKRLHLSNSGQVRKDLQQIESVDPGGLSGSLKPYYSFLFACYKGWDEAEALLDTHFQAENQQEFSQFVAVEHKACFVESIQLYHDSPLTKQGMEIIDTPGADSIYSRHTNVTFNYIKNADVIIYVTYYNHAFSRADRQFLDQLGRVKDQFALDKMFFLVNAADLAETPAELQGVVNHVQENLLQSGIRFPRIFPISSLRALQGEADSGMEAFEQAFFSFVREDLTALLVEGAQKDVERGYHLLKEMQDELNSSVEERAAKIAVLEERQQKWVKVIEEESYPAYLKELEKEIEEHSYYINQRLFYGFLAHFQEAFNPAVLSQERGGKAQLQLCLDELLHSLLFQLKEELKATSLRLENFLYRLRDRAVVDWQRQIEGDGILLSGESLTKEELGLPTLPEQFELSNKRELEQTLSYFKNPKQFFEEGGKEKLRQALEAELHAVVESYLAQAKEVFQLFYKEAWQGVEKGLKAGLQAELQVAVAARLSALRGELSATRLAELISEYKQQIR